MKTSERPRTVAAFEVLAIGEVGLTFALDPELSLAGLGSPLLSLFLIVCITRLRSRAARWIYSGITILAILAIPYWSATGMITEISAATWLFLVIAPVELGLLWSPPTSRWMASNPKLNDGTAAVGGD